MGFVASILGAAASAASASSSVASEAMTASESAIDSAVQNGMDLAWDDTEDIRKAAEEAANSESKNFFSRAWDESKQSLGIGGNGTDMGKVGYNAAKMAVSKGDSSEPQRMDPAPVQTSAPAAPASNAEDELNRLRNRMNIG